MTDSRARFRGIVCILASAFGFALMAFFVRLCDDYGAHVSSFQKSFFRNAIALVIALCVFCQKRRQSAAEERGTFSRLTPQQWLYLLGRSTLGTIGIFANFYALSRIPIGEAMTLNKTAPFFTVFFAWMMMGEKVSRRQGLCLLGAFFGVLLVMKPLSLHMASVWGLVGGACAGFAYACVHKLGRLKTNGTLIVLFFSAFSCFASLPFTLWHYTPMTLAQFFILLGAGAGAAIGQFGVTAAYRFAEPRDIAVFDYSNIIFTSILGFIFFSQIPDLLAVFGFVAIVLSALSLKHANSSP